MHYGFTIICQPVTKEEVPISPPKNEHFHYSSNDKSVSYYFEYLKNERFSGDKLFVENQEYIFGIDGVILNLELLKKEFLISDWKELFLALLFKHNHLIVNLLIGEFSGFVFNKKEENLYFFTNQTSSTKVYYYNKNGITIISPSLQKISDFLISKRQTIKLNRTSAYSLLTSGGMYGNSTLMQDVFRLRGGEYLEFNSKNIVLKKYLDYNNIEPEEIPEDKLIDKLEELFQFALQLEYQKDQQYGYDHLATLSGGLDSRMNVFLAQKLGYEVSNLCFSQKGYDDELIAKSIAEHLEQELTFVPLDNGEYVFDFDENMEIYEGQIFYTTSAHFNFAVKKIDLEPFGLIHTGLLGDGILGTYITQPKTGPPNLKSKLNSKILFPKIETELKELASQYASEDIYNLYQRFFNVIISGAFAMQKYTYLVSPFMLPEFIKLCLKIPPRFKYNEKIYIKWINKHHSELTNFKWESTGFKPKYTWQTPLSRYTKKAKSLWYRFQGKSHQLTMTPYQYWYKTNPRMSIFMNSIFDKNINLLDEDKELKNDATKLFKDGNALEKTLVMTLLGAIEQLKISI